MVRKPMDLFWCKENEKCKTKQNILLETGTGIDKLWNEELANKLLNVLNGSTPTYMWSLSSVTVTYS